MKKDNRGGKREGAGRKPLPEGLKRVTLWISPTEHQVQLLGQEQIQKVAMTAVNREYYKTLRQKEKEKIS